LAFNPATSMAAIADLVVVRGIAGDADRAEQRCFAPVLLNATKFRVRRKKRRAAPICLKAAGSPDDSDRIDSLRRYF
jgi:hypothetical protein